MGKKNKSKGLKAEEGPAFKKLKISEPIMVNYEEMPVNHKRKLFIYDDCGVMYKYIGLISWLRFMGCFSGSVFNGIGNLNYVHGQGYPFVEVEIVTPSDNSAKFIIFKNDLYLVVFFARKWYQFSSSLFKISLSNEGFTELGNRFTGAYTSEPWKSVGPKVMIDAINSLATRATRGDLLPLVQSVEVFCVHLCEATRLLPLELLICRTLAPLSTAEAFHKTTFENEEKVLAGAVSIEEDIYSLVKANGPIDFSNTLAAPNVIGELIKNFSNLSKMWFLYSLTDNECFVMKPEDASIYKMRSVKSLRCTLGVLCNINLDKLLNEWQLKKHTLPMTPTIYKKMEDKVRELQNQAKVFKSKN